MEVRNNLREIVYESVSEEYGWGKYGEFRVLIRRKDGFVNITKLCRDGGRRFEHWLENNKSKELIKWILKDIKRDGMEIYALESIKNVSNNLRGTYVHPDLVPHIAMWISPRFGIIVSRIIREWRELSFQNEENYWTEMGDCIINYPSEKDQEEKKWQGLVAAQEQGTIEVETLRGRIDVLTPTKVIEVKRADLWNSRPAFPHFSRGCSRRSSISFNLRIIKCPRAFKKISFVILYQQTLPFRSSLKHKRLYRLKMISFCRKEKSEQEGQIVDDYFLEGDY